MQQQFVKSLELIQEIFGAVKQMQGDYTKGTTLVQSALDKFDRVKRGEDGKSMEEKDIEQTVKKFLVMPTAHEVAAVVLQQVDIAATVKDTLRQLVDGVTPTIEEVAEELLSSKRFIKYVKKYAKPGKNADPTDIDAIIEAVRTQLEAQPIHFQRVAGLESKFAELRAHVAGSTRGGGDTIVAGSGVTIVDTVNGNKRISASGGAGFTRLTATGAVNAANVTFTFTQAPTYVVADGVWYEAVDNNLNVQWTIAGLTVTMVNPPAFSIYGVA